MREVTEALLALLSRGGTGALATVVRSSGSTPQRPGARMLLTAEGDLIGTIGGGAIEHLITDELRRCLVDRTPRLVEKDLLRELGMCCGGRMEVFVEPVRGRDRLIVFGAGHVGRAVAAIAQTIDMDVVVVDPREELNTEVRLPGCTRILAEPRESLERVAPTERDLVLIVTHDHRLDEEALDTYARAPHAYVGMIGSKRKVFRILQRIHARRGLPPMERVYAPVGLAIGAVSPEEIAVSIAAELVAVRHGKGGPHMRAIDDPALYRVLAGDAGPDEAVAEAE